jgi:Putative peptidoglycan binding domain
MIHPYARQFYNRLARRDPTAWNQARRWNAEARFGNWRSLAALRRLGAVHAHYRRHYPQQSLSPMDWNSVAPPAPSQQQQPPAPSGPTGDSRLNQWAQKIINEITSNDPQGAQDLAFVQSKASTSANAQQLYQAITNDPGVQQTLSASSGAYIHGKFVAAHPGAARPAAPVARPAPPGAAYRPAPPGRPPPPVNYSRPAPPVVAPQPGTFRPEGFRTSEDWDRGRGWGGGGWGGWGGGRWGRGWGGEGAVYPGSPGWGAWSQPQINIQLPSVSDDTTDSSVSTDTTAPADGAAPVDDGTVSQDDGSTDVSGYWDRRRGFEGKSGWLRRRYRQHWPQHILEDRPPPPVEPMPPVSGYRGGWGRQGVRSWSRGGWGRWPTPWGMDPQPLLDPSLLQDASGAYINGKFVSAYPGGQATFNRPAAPGWRPAPPARPALTAALWGGRRPGWGGLQQGWGSQPWHHRHHHHHHHWQQQQQQQQPYQPSPTDGGGDGGGDADGGDDSSGRWGHHHHHHHYNNWQRQQAYQNGAYQNGGGDDASGAHGGFGGGARAHGGGHSWGRGWAGAFPGYGIWGGFWPGYTIPTYELPDEGFCEDGVSGDDPFDLGAAIQGVAALAPELQPVLQSAAATVQNLASQAASQAGVSVAEGQSPTIVASDVRILGRAANAASTIGTALAGTSVAAYPEATKLAAAAHQHVLKAARTGAASPPPPGWTMTPLAAQTALRIIDLFPKPLTGVVDAFTVRAVKLFQGGEEGLKVDGIVGPKTKPILQQRAREKLAEMRTARPAEFQAWLQHQVAPSAVSGLWTYPGFPSLLAAKTPGIPGMELAVGGRGGGGGGGGHGGGMRSLMREERYVDRLNAQQQGDGGGDDSSGAWFLPMLGGAALYATVDAMKHGGLVHVAETLGLKNLYERIKTRVSGADDNEMSYGPGAIGSRTPAWVFVKFDGADLASALASSTPLEVLQTEPRGRGIYHARVRFRGGDDSSSWTPPSAPLSTAQGTVQFLSSVATSGVTPWSYPIRSPSPLPWRVTHTGGVTPWSHRVGRPPLPWQVTHTGCDVSGASYAERIFLERLVRREPKAWGLLYQIRQHSDEPRYRSLLSRLYQLYQERASGAPITSGWGVDTNSQRRTDLPRHAARHLHQSLKKALAA